MRKPIAIISFTVLALAAGSSGAQQIAPQGADGSTPPARTPMQQHMASLVAQCPPASRMPEAEADKLPIDVTRWGASGPRVLIVHGGVQGGLGGGPRNFARQKVLGDEGWQLDVVDRPGFGKSPSRGVDDMEADAHWIAKMLGSGANLMGHSWGGAEALLAAAQRPNAVQSLILIEPAVRVLLMADPSVAHDASIKADADRFASVLVKAQTPGQYGLEFARSLGTVDGKANPAAAALEADPARATKEGCALLQARMASFGEMKQAAETIAKAGIPTLIITGGWNPLYDKGADVLAKLTHGQHVVVPSKNHFVQVSNPDDFNKVVVEFMRKADATPRSEPATR